jgi:L-threonylcarbamoyladenylate synthase
MNNIYKAVEILKNGGIIAYPTEAVFGLGCNPFNELAVVKTLQIKKRPIDKGLILIASDWQQIKELTAPIPESLLNKVFATWPGPTTWIFPASPKAPHWITGTYNSIALRITAHPIAKQICEEYGGAIVSTSANIEGMPPAINTTQVAAIFGNNVDFIMPGTVGDLTKPTVIIDVLSDRILRS